MARSGSRGHAAAPAPHECRRTRRPASTPTAGGGCSQTQSQRPGRNRRPRGRRPRSRKGPKEAIRTDIRLASHYRVRLACESPGVPQRRRASRSGLGRRNSTAPVGCQFSPACSLGRRDDVFRRRSLPGMKPAVRGPIVAAAWAVCGRRPGRDRPRAGRPRRRLRVTSTSGRSRQGSRRSSSSPPTRTAMRSTRGRSSCCASAFATAGPRTEW